MVVDDRPEISDVLALYLRDAGYAVTVFNQGARALEALEVQQFDALLVDVVMPDFSGLTLAERAAARGMAVILISGDPSTIGKLEGRFRHVFLEKPFHLEQLGSAIAPLLAEREKALGHVATD